MFEPNVLVSTFSRKESQHVRQFELVRRISQSKIKKQAASVKGICALLKLQHPDGQA